MNATAHRRARRAVTALLTALVLSAPFAVVPSSTAASGNWASAATLNTGRAGHTATAFGDGRVLVAGGTSASGPAAPTELYDSRTEPPGWQPSPPLVVPRSGHTATLLTDGRVLITGGRDASANILASAEVFDPATATWTLTTPMLLPRADHTATVLNDGTGRVLVTGGATRLGATDTTEIYDPSTAVPTWTLGPSLRVGRTLHTATALSDGTVLVAGGRGGPSGPVELAERYQPVTNEWTKAGSLREARFSHTATLLPSGDVLVVGGRGAAGALASAEVSQLSLEVWRPVGPLSEPRDRHTATLLNDGTVLVAAGATSRGDSLASAEVYDSAREAWTGVSRLSAARDRHTASLLPTGEVLVAGGQLGSGGTTTTLDSAERFVPIASPVVTGLNPTSGPASAGVFVDIIGGNFTGATSVAFGSMSASDFTVLSDGLIRAVSPPQPVGTVDVTVTNPAGTSAPSPAARFTYIDKPGTVTDLDAATVSSSQISVTFSAPDDGSGSALATDFIVKQSTERITDANFYAATALCGGVCRFPPGAARLTLNVGDLPPSTTYYYALKAINHANIVGDMSNVDKARTKAR